MHTHDTPANPATLRPGVIDMHYDLLMDLYEKRGQAGVLRRDYLADMRAGGIAVVGAAIYLEDKYLPEMALRVALDQIARLRIEVDGAPEFALCTSGADIAAAQSAGRIALVISMEGVEPLGTDLDLLRIFHALGVRMIGLTHARRNMAADGGIFAPRGSSPQGLTAFGRDVVRECERLGIVIDLAHINPAGFDEIVSITQKPLVVSHSNPRAFYDIERNLSDEQIRAIGARGGVIGVNSVLVSPRSEMATLDHFIDHIEYVAELAGIDAVGLGFDFFERIFNSLPESERRDMATRLAEIHFVPGLTHHGHAGVVAGKLVERGWGAADVDKVVRGNWLRVLAAL